MGKTLILGANVSLTRAIETFEAMSKMNSGFKHLEGLAKHWRKVANVGVRNVSYIMICYSFSFYNFDKS